MTRDNWDDLRFVLAVAETGTVSAAARALGVNHATVLRRIAAFEARAGIELFDKTPRGYLVPADKARVIAAAREVDASVQAVARLLQGTHAPLQGAVRVTSTDTLCQAILAPILADLRAEAPDLRVDLISANAHVDLARLQADVTVRPAATLPDDLVGESPARLGFAAYRPAGSEPGFWLGLSGVLIRSLPGQWMEEARTAGLRIAGSSDSFLVLREMAAVGLGLAILPCCLGDDDPRLVKVPGVIPAMSVPIWVASHSDLTEVSRIRAVRGALMTRLRAIAPRLAGDRLRP